MHTTLLRSQKNDIFALIEAQKLNPSEFEWSSTVSRHGVNRGEQIAKLAHTPTGFYFVFDHMGSSPTPQYFPAPERAEVVNVSPMQDSWRSVLGVVDTWVFILAKEYLQPDLWDLSKADRRLIAKRIDDVENPPFDLAEQRSIAAAIREIHEHLKRTGSHSDDQLKFIASRLKHLEDASTRLGRKDWITLAVGTLTNIVVGAALAPDAARELFRTAGTLLAWVIASAASLP